MVTTPTLRSEPATIISALSAAIVATINVLSLLFDWSADVTAGLNICAAAWVAFAGFVIRARVSPVGDDG